MKPEQHPIEQRLILARRQLRKAGTSLETCAALPHGTKLAISAFAQDCQIQASTVLQKLHFVRTVESLDPQPSTLDKAK